MAKCPYHDPFKEAREKDGLLITKDKGQEIPMLLRHRDVRKAARDYATFSSDAPFEVPIPSEEDVRPVRQIPIELDPPLHTEYRKIVDPFFSRPKDPAFADQVDGLIEGLLAGIRNRAGEAVDIVNDFALPLQSRALALLLNMPQSEAEIWIGWGTHVFREGDGVSKGAALNDYLNAQFDRAEAKPGDDFFSSLTQATFNGRRLTRDEMLGYANLAFAGGRDTIINMVAVAVWHLAEVPEDLSRLRENEALINPACEEIIRYSSPLTHIGRKCTRATELHGRRVNAGDRVSLGWAAANFDESVFEEPERIVIDRKPNPHVAFGTGAHTCIGAPHARLILRRLLFILSRNVQRLKIKEAVPNVENAPGYQRPNAFETLRVNFDL